MIDTERIEALERALAKYGKHERGCEYDTVSGLCGCGLYTALTRRTIERHNALRNAKRTPRDAHD